MFIPKSWRRTGLAHSPPKYLMPKHSLSLQQCTQLCFKDQHFTYEILLTIDNKKLKDLSTTSTISKIDIISTFLETQNYIVYGMFESPQGNPTNVHFHGVLSGKHTDYDKFISLLKRKFLRPYVKTIGLYSFIRINHPVENYKPTDIMSGMHANRTIGSFPNYHQYINKSIKPCDKNTYLNTFIKRK